jgi:hypothetical protein
VEEIIQWLPRIPQDQDVFNLKILAILGLIIASTLAIIKNAKTFHFSFQTWTWPFRASCHDPF